MLWYAWKQVSKKKMMVRSGHFFFVCVFWEYKGCHFKQPQIFRGSTKGFLTSVYIWENCKTWGPPPPLSMCCACHWFRVLKIKGSVLIVWQPCKVFCLFVCLFLDRWSRSKQLCWLNKAACVLLFIANIISDKFQTWQTGQKIHPSFLESFV